jgi:hypothetical protein
MLNHLKNRLLGSNRRALVRGLFLCGSVFLSCPAQPSPPPGTAEVGQIVVLVDGQGHRIYVNTQEQDSAFKFRDSSSQNNCSALASRNPGLASLIRQAADRHQMDPDLIHAVVRVESGCNSRAVSRKGAMGMMQLIPATARRFGVENPFDPEQNIEGGTSYLKYLLGLFDGNLALSLAAYNAGENSVLREGGIPPFPETREYVRRVRSFYQPVLASNASESRAGAGNSALGVWSAKRPVRTGKAAAQTLKPMGAPLYRYVDAQGVLHIEQ